MTQSKPPKTAPPKRPVKPQRPPTKPPKKGSSAADDLIFAAVDALDADLRVPPSSLCALAVDAAGQLRAPLRLLVAAVLEADCDPAARAHLNAAAQHVSLALSRLAHIETPARPLPVSGRALADGPVNSGRGGEVPGSGRPDRFSLPLRPAVPRFEAPLLDSRTWLAGLGFGPQHDALPLATVEGPPWPSTPPLPPPHPQKAAGKPKPVPWPRPPTPQPQGG